MKMAITGVWNSAKNTDLGYTSGGGQPSAGATGATGGGGSLWRSGLAEGRLEEMNMDQKWKHGTWMTFVINIKDNC